MARIIEYLRVSTPQQKEQYGFDRQHRDVTTFCKSHDHEIVSDFRDDYTGMTPLPERPEGRKVIAMLKAGKADGLCIARVNRLGRSFPDLVVVVRDLTKAGFPVYSADLGLIPSELDIRFIINAWESQKDHDDTIDKLAQGREDKARKGKWVGGGGHRSTPFGYSVIGAGKKVSLSIDPIAAEIVREIFERYSMDVPASQIADDLNSRGILSARKTAWTKNAVVVLMENRAYMGMIHYKDIEFHDPNLQIVSNDLWHACEIMRGRNWKHAPKNYDYLMSRGRLECICGSSMSGTSGGKNKRRYYACWKHTLKATDSRHCDHGRFSMSDVEQTAIFWLMDLVLFKDHLQSLVDDMSKRADTELAPIRERRDSLNALIDETSGRIATYIQEIGNTKDEFIKNSYREQLRIQSDLIKDLTTKRDEAQRRVDEYGIWAEGKPITAEKLKIELDDIWNFKPARAEEFVSGSAEDLAHVQLVRFSMENLNRDKARAAIEKYNLRAQVVLEGGITKFRMSCSLFPEGETINITPDTDEVMVNVAVLARRNPLTRT